MLHMHIFSPSLIKTQYKLLSLGVTFWYRSICQHSSPLIRYKSCIFVYFCLFLSILAWCLGLTGVEAFYRENIKHNHDRIGANNEAIILDMAVKSIILDWSSACTGHNGIDR